MSPRATTWSDGQGPVDALVLAVTNTEERVALLSAFLGVDKQKLPCVAELSVGKARPPLRIALDVIGDQGGASASAFTSSRLRVFSPSLAVLIGTCGGSSAQIRTNDVVVSNLVIEYELAKQEQSTSRPRPRFFVPPSGLLRQACDYVYGPSADWTSDWKREVDRRELEIKREPTPPCALVAPIAGGEKLILDGSLPELADRFHEKLAAVEMEGHGFAEACYQQGIPWLVVRGVSDLAVSSDRGAPSRFVGPGSPPDHNVLRPYPLSSALAAALVTREILRSVDISPEGLLGGVGPPVRVIYDIRKAFESSKRLQSRAHHRVSIVSANAAYDKIAFERYSSVPLRKGVKVLRIIDFDRWADENIVAHLMDKWEYFPRSAGEDPQYEVHFARAGGVGSVVIDEEDTRSASFFLYWDETKCLYLETNRREAFHAANARLESLKRQIPFKPWNFSTPPSEAELLKVVKESRRELFSRA